jgi:hypothetical protein
MHAVVGPRMGVHAATGMLRRLRWQAKGAGSIHNRLTRAAANHNVGKATLVVARPATKTQIGISRLPSPTGRGVGGVGVQKRAMATQDPSG